MSDDVLFAPGGRVVIRTYGVASPAAEDGTSAPVSYCTWVTGVRDQPRYWRWRHFEEARRGHLGVIEWLTGRGPQPGAAAGPGEPAPATGPRKGGPSTGPNPVDRGTSGSKVHHP
ncbi:hypothetical protein GCM10010140_04010 [Streptosporangium pseudovulgare]|uniref:Uncharacterized protein n=1 Tax=Streptosporangium pseudovulgare TaxID=35765 RepID=A0ABQ2QES8_9ACTN|nr:hypothetical protein GCM10010140_04010 [Streptosporangium pseudovulgare]